MIIPIRTDYRMSRRPWVNYALMAINVIVFILGYNAASARGMAVIDGWLLHPDAPELYQFFSSMFLHGHWGHLLGNMIFLWVFGNALNDRFGHLGYLTFYLAGGVLAGVGYVLLSGYAPVLGASGAISAITGAYLVLFPRVRVTVLALFIYILTFEVSSLYFLLFQFIINMWMSLSPALTGHTGGGVAYAAHSSGYIFGIAVAGGLLALKILPRDVYDLLNLIRTWGRRRGYRRMVQGGHDPFARAGTRGPVGEKRWVQAQAVDAAPDDSTEARRLQLREQITQACERNDLADAVGKYLQLVQVAEKPILPRQQQLDVANHLMADQRHPAAADAYERFVEHYGNYEYIADIFLMLGLLYGRYLQQYDRAEQFLERAIKTLRDPHKIELARGDLQAVQKHRGG